MVEIFVCKPGAISDEDRTMLFDAGVLVVQLENPDEFRLVRAQPELSAGVILAAALTGLEPSTDDPSSRAGRNRAKFVEELAKAARCAARPASGERNAE